MIGNSRSLLAGTVTALLLFCTLACQGPAITPADQSPIDLVGVWKESVAHDGRQYQFEFRANGTCTLSDGSGGGSGGTYEVSGNLLYVTDAGGVVTTYAVVLSGTTLTVTDKTTAGAPTLVLEKQ